MNVTPVALTEWQSSGVRSMSHATHRARLRPIMMSFDVFGTLISVRDSSYGAFAQILADAGAHHLDARLIGCLVDTNWRWFRILTTTSLR